MLISHYDKDILGESIYLTKIINIAENSLIRRKARKHS